MVFGAETFLRCPADVSFADKRLKRVSETSSIPKLTKDVFVLKNYGSLGDALGQVWYFIVSIPDLCLLYFVLTEVVWCFKTHNCNLIYADKKK